MSSDGGHTTEVAPSSPPLSARDTRWALSWVFPRPAFTAISTSSGPAHAEGVSATEHDALVMGRDPACAVPLGGTEVSRRHAAVRHQSGGRPRVVDLASRNGVYVNGRRVSEADLQLGDVVRIGSNIAVVTDGESALQEVAPGLFGGARFQAELAPLRKAATSDLPVVLEGETGTGKEIVSRSVHMWSTRPGALVAVNCAALPEAIAEGELFGYRKGAFTGADKSTLGFFRSADRGTLLLDEVTDLPLGIQAKLLRALEAREVQPLGEAKPVPVDVRVIVAGQQSLVDAVSQGSFRADLLARLDGITVRLPPLRARREDVIPLFSRLLSALSPSGGPALESDLVERLLIHDWPFNVRELVLLVRRLLVLYGNEPSLRASHLSERIGANATTDTKLGAPSAIGDATSAAAAWNPGPTDERAAERVGFRALMGALRVSAGNVARAAAMLGITRQRAYRLMEGREVDLTALRRPPEDTG